VSEQAQLPPPTDPWADATAAEEITPRVIYAAGADPVGVDVEDASGTGEAAPARRGRRVVVLVAVATIVVVAGAGVVVGRELSRHNTTGGPSHGPSVAGPPAAGVPVAGTAPSGTPSAAPSPSDPAPASAASASAGTSGPSPVDSPRPTDPDGAMALTDKQATAELNREADEDGDVVAGLAGHWVPQVDGKCVGLTVDIQPSWAPDGKPDTPSVTVQQILAYHLALHQRFEALTARPSQVGDPDVPTSGPCAGHSLWYSVVTTTFDSDTAANAWCDAHGLPVHECLARYVPKPDESAKTTERH
jgi:hypothetical protein